MVKNTLAAVAIMYIGRLQDYFMYFYAIFIHQMLSDKKVLLYF